VFGVDCLGAARGRAIAARGRTALAHLRGDPFVDRLTAVVHAGDCQGKWWTTVRDSKRGLRRRMANFWTVVGCHPWIPPLVATFGCHPWPWG
jgi:hypothetical protein